ncbi:MAG: DUF6531 domain-containing protein [Firmicutes bacterium]|nr:DUF6531 domain-containing protein [Bacillota bacterium]
MKRGYLALIAAFFMIMMISCAGDGGFNQGKSFFGSKSGVKTLDEQIGIKPFWTYDHNAVGGTGAFMVNLKSGNLVHQATDVSFPGRGLPIEFRRTYNSQWDYTGPLGKGWTHIYNSWIEENTDGTVTLHDGYGGIFTFTNPHLESGKTFYDAPAGRDTVFAKLSDGTYLEKKKNNTKYLYGTNGKLTRLQHRNINNYIDLVYDTTGKLVSLDEASGRQTTFTYTGNYITKITDPQGREYEFEYTGDLLTKVTDPEGCHTHYSYTSDILTGITNPRGFSHSIEYDLTGKVLSFSTPLHTVSYTYGSTQTTVSDTYGHEIEYTLDSFGRSTSITDTMNNTTTFLWNTSHKITSVTNPKNQTTNYTWSVNGNLTQVTNPLYSVGYAWDSDNNLVASTNGNNKTTTFAYSTDANNPYGKLSSVTSPTNKTVTFFYNTYGLPTSVTDARGNATAYYYSADGNITRVRNALNQDTDFTYNYVGEALTVKDALNRITTFSYDDNGLVLSVTSPQYHSTSYEYDANGNKTKVTDANDHSTEYTFNAEDEMLTVKDALNQITTYTYQNGNLHTTTDPSGFVTTMTYDANDRMTQRTNPITTEGYSYDEVGNVTQKTTQNSNGNISYTYDALNRVTGVSMSEWSGAYTYDNCDNVLTSNATGFYYDLAENFTYNDDNLLTSKHREIGNFTVEDTSYQYDNNGNMTYRNQQICRAFNPCFGPLDSYPTTYVYDDLNRQVSVTGPGGSTITCQFDAAGALSQVNYPDNTSCVFERDSEGKVTKVTNTSPLLDPNEIEYQYTYDNVGNFLTSKRVPWETSPKAYQYDALNRVIRDETAGKTFTYYNNNRTRETLISNGSYIDQSYYNHKVTSRIGSTGSGIYPLYYDYDSNGNRISEHPLNYRDGGTNYSYFPTGRPRSKSVFSPTEQTDSWCFAYDGGQEFVSHEHIQVVQGEDEMTSSRDKSGYNAKILPPETFAGKVFAKKFHKKGLRSLKNLKPTPKGANLDRHHNNAKMDLSHYFEGTSLCGYEGDNKLYEKETNIVIQNSQVLSDYSEYYTEYNIYLSGLKVGYYLTAHDASGGSLGSASYYCLYDGQGNIVQISNKIGDLPYYLFKYDTYGNTLETQTNGEDSEPGGYKGYDQSAIYFKTGARHYDPNTGTFMTPDPFKGYMDEPQSQLPYMYCAGNPIKYSDPSGYYWETALDIAGLGVDAYDFYKKPSWGGAAWIIADIAGIALPIPVGSFRVTAKIAKYTKKPESITKQMKRMRSEGYELHHLFPKEYESFFKKAGIEIEEYENKIWLKHDSHKIVHGKGGGDAYLKSWNKRWGDYFKKNPNANSKAILNHFYDLRLEFFGIPKPVKIK